MSVENEFERLRAEQSQLQSEFEALRKKRPRDVSEHRAFIARLEAHMAKLHAWRKRMQTAPGGAEQRHEESDGGPTATNHP
jgi:hypothetical protein